MNSTEHNLPINVTNINENDETICLRIKGTLNYTIVIPTDSNQNDIIENLFNLIINDLRSLKFIIKPLNLVIGSKKCRFASCFQILQEYFKNKEIKFDDLNKSLMESINVDLFKSKHFTEKENHYSPYFINHKGVGCIRTFNIPLDCITFARKETTTESLNFIIHDKLKQQVNAIKNCYKEFYQDGKNFEAQAFHYLLKDQNLFITCIYPNTASEELLAKTREKIHHYLNLSEDRPVIRRANSYEFRQTRIENNKCLKTPHLTLKAPSANNGKISLVKGDYLYFHYMQNNLNDNGWGCAYRSFQTIFSWFKFHSYTQKPIPNHSEIQKILVDIGDKPKEFVGSHKWIGSLEISYCLDKMLNVESKIMSLSKGSELSNKAREIQYHFETEGTPIMIGGGLLAHTIIGVNFDEVTGSVQYLILDPHYIGPEELKTIAGKGWIGWKDVKFWKEDSFYNLCCPITPKGL